MAECYGVMQFFFFFISVYICFALLSFCHVRIQHEAPARCGDLILNVQPLEPWNNIFPLNLLSLKYSLLQLKRIKIQVTECLWWISLFLCAYVLQYIEWICFCVVLHTGHTVININKGDYSYYDSYMCLYFIMTMGLSSIKLLFMTENYSRAIDKIISQGILIYFETYSLLPQFTNDLNCFNWLVMKEVIISLWLLNKFAIINAFIKVQCNAKDFNY